MSKCKACQNGEMVLKTANEEMQHRGKGKLLVVPLPYLECNACGFDVVNYDLMIEHDAILKETYIYSNASDLELLRRGKIRTVGKVRARKLRRKGVLCWWSAELYSRVRTGLNNRRG